MDPQFIWKEKFDHRPINQLKSIKFVIKYHIFLKNICNSYYTLIHKNIHKLIWRQFSPNYQPYSGFLFYDPFNEIEDLNSAVRTLYWKVLRLIFAGNNPKSVAWSNYVLCYVWVYIGNIYIYIYHAKEISSLLFLTDTNNTQFEW
jgi:hypothetical protein